MACNMIELVDADRNETSLTKVAEVGRIQRRIALKLDSSRSIVRGMKKVGIDFVSSLPSTNLSPLVTDVMRDNEFTHAPVSNEGDSIGVLPENHIRAY